MSDLIERLNDLASREATTMPPGWSDAYTLYKDAAAALAAKDAEIAKLHAENVVLMEKNAGALDLAVSENARAEKAEAEIERLRAECARRDAVIDVEREARREAMDLLVAHTQAQEALGRAVQAEAEVERLRNLLGHVLRLDKEVGTNSTIHDIARDALNEKEDGDD